MSKITKMPLQATITKIPPTTICYRLILKHHYLPNYPHNRQLPNYPQFRLHKLTTLSEITKLTSDRKITEMSLKS